MTNKHRLLGYRIPESLDGLKSFARELEELHRKMDGLAVLGDDSADFVFQVVDAGRGLVSVRGICDIGVGIPSLGGKANCALGEMSPFCLGGLSIDQTQLPAIITRLREIIDTLGGNGS